MPLQPFLETSTYVDWNHPRVAGLASRFSAESDGPVALTRRCFEFVRDEIAHSGDARRNPVTVKASDVLLHGTGFCYAKSHLLAALLRANGIPAGLCYQRLSAGGSGPPYCLHGLNAVWLPGHGWYRLDARGNKPGVTAAFTPPIEALAFAIREAAERDLPEIWSEPLTLVTQRLEHCRSVEELAANLPDIPLISR